MQDEPEKVLIIEDDKDIADVVAMNLEDLGLRADRAVDGRAGLQKAGACSRWRAGPARGRDFPSHWMPARLQFPRDEHVYSA
jgi:CheY-like chemotaxis protein